MHFHPSVRENRDGIDTSVDVPIAGRYLPH